MSEIKVNKISPRSGTTVTLGDSGDTFTIPSGATINNQGTATNFGATGAASWNTTVKTGDFTAVAGEGYFVNTTSGAVNVTLPAGTAGAVVAIKDYAGTFDTNAVTLTRNGSDKIGGIAVNAELSTEGIAVTLVFVDSTQGWLVTDSGLQDEAPTPQYICASVSGSCNTLVTDGDFKVAIFKGPGTFTVSCAGNPGGSDTVEYLTVAGGGGAGISNGGGGGGGAGGFRQNYPSPITAGLPVSVQAYPIAVSAGGAGGPGVPNSTGNRGTSAGVSTFSTITSAGGGGGGGGNNNPLGPGLAGGSGGGGGRSPSSTGGAGNTPPVSPPQGNNGGRGSPCGQNTGGGGGGAGGAGSDYTPGSGGGAGGIGSPIATTLFGPTAPSYGTPGPAAGRYFSGGGGGNEEVGPNPPGPGGAGGGGAGGAAGSGVPGTASTGGGGGGGDYPNNQGGNGGSGIVVIRYKFQ